MTADTPGSPAPETGRSRTPALVTICAGMLMVVLDGSIVSVALPSIQAELGFSDAGLTWTVNAYLIAFGGLLLLAGRLGDLIGRKRMFVAGLIVFTVASLACALAGSQAMLVAARFAQGAGGAMTAAVSLGMVATLYPRRRERGRAMGAVGFVGAAGASIGQVAGGLLTEAMSWHWIFVVNLPIGFAAAVVAVRVLDPDRDRATGRVDLAGAVLATSGLMLGVYTIVETERFGWGSPHTLGFGALSLALLAGFLLRQHTAADPLLPLRMFRSRNVSGANAVQILLESALFGFQVLIVLYLQNVLGYGAAAAGMAMLPAATLIGLVSLGVSARLIARFGDRAVLLAGLVLLVGALGLLTRLPADADYAVDLLPSMVLACGFGLAIPSLSGLGMSDARPDDAGVASGLFNTTRHVGGALGVAVLSTLATGRTGTLTEAGADSASALTGGFRLAFGVGAGLIVVAAVLAAVVLRAPAAPRAKIPAGATSARNR
ncbi:MFS transporter [Amycolatopsis antarctica]|uniref:MFS transporter n=1 Tax=Amycolatopsis antarctica TaxID=1854586 RepID=A0A263D934_9PSEU|nr:DHA2 family efflux MFS transporter permease subunit [Amycolatopsis antarctica]OZM74973.1 MFS transporter [Amycolatopsis antarctica]